MEIESDVGVCTSQSRSKRVKCCTTYNIPLVVAWPLLSRDIQPRPNYHTLLCIELGRVVLTVISDPRIDLPEVGLLVVHDSGARVKARA